MKKEQKKNLEMAQTGLKAGMQIIGAFGGSGGGQTRSAGVETQPTHNVTTTPEVPPSGISSAAQATAEAASSEGTKDSTQNGPSSGSTGDNAVTAGKSTGDTPASVKAEEKAPKEAKRSTPVDAGKPSATSQGFGTAAKALGGAAAVAGMINPVAGLVVGAVAGACQLVSSLTS